MGRSLFTLAGLAFFALFLVFPLAVVFASAVPQPLPARLLAANLWQAVLSASVSLLLGLPFAWALSKGTPFSFLLRGLSLVPLVLPQPAMILSLVVLSGSNGIVRLPFPVFGLEGVVLAHALYNFPLAGRILSGSYLANSGYAGVARSLGASRAKAFFSVTLPLLFPAAVSAFAVAFAYSFTSFSIPLVLGGPSNPTVEVEIYRSLLRDFDAGRAAFLALVQVLVFVPFALAWKSVAWVSRPIPQRGQDRLHFAVSLSFAALLLLVLLGPLLRFSAASVSLGPLANSLALASVSACLSLLLWLSAGRILARYSFLLFGVSPLVLAVAYYPFPHSFPLLAVGHSLLAFPLVCSALGPSSAAIERLSGVAASLGAGRIARTFGVVVPAFSAAFLTAFFFAFGFSLGETGMVLSLGGGMHTLSSASVSAFSSYRFSLGYFYVLVLTFFAFSLSLLVEKTNVFGGKA